MKLKSIDQKSFIHLERWVNNPKYSSTAQYSEISKPFHPRYGDMNFFLKYFSIPKHEVEIFMARPSRSIRNIIIGKKSVTFFCHPDALAEFESHAPFQKIAGENRVMPTSSSRTVLFADGVLAGSMAKLHVNKRISRFIRRLTRSSIAHSVAISNECERIMRHPGCPKEFAFLPESIGINYKKLNVGFLIREAPRPVAPKPRIIIPFFALYSKDEKAPGDSPILVQLIRKHDPKHPLRFFMRHVFEPFIKCWAFAFLNFGILFESHGQNTLLELDAKSFVPTRIVQRDFQSTPIDPSMRKARGLKNNFRKHVIGEEDYPPYLEHSLIFDHFIGDYLFISFRDFFKREFGIAEEKFEKAAQDVFRKFIPHHIEKKFFPAGHVVFGDKVHENTCSLLYLNEAPLFRSASCR